MRYFYFFLLLLISFACHQGNSVKLGTPEALKATPIETVSLVILGTVQDAGSPHIGCTKKCCKSLFENPDPNRMVVSLGIIDPENKKDFMFEASPDFSRQLKMLKDYSPNSDSEMPNGIFLTHAHIGHYTGLMYLGKEAKSADSVPVYAMPRMKTFLEENEPWSQLYANGNIALKTLSEENEISLTSNIQVTPFKVPHRDEYSETVGYKIKGPNKKVLFIPDIDKWSKWDKNIIEEISKVDYAFIDATFYDAEEINYRDISQIPHPFVIESISLLDTLPRSEKKKIYFIHFNHTNPLLNKQGKQAQYVLEKGFKIAQPFDIIAL